MESQVSDPVPPLRPCCAGGVTTCAVNGGGGLMFGAVNLSGLFWWMFQKIGESTTLKKEVNHQEGI